MRSRRVLLSVIILLLSVAVSGKEVTGISPNGKIRFSFRLTDSFPLYNVWYEDIPLIIASPLTLTFSEFSLAKNVRMGTPVDRDGEDNYSLPVGRNSTVHDLYHECSIPLTVGDKKITLVVRLYNEGVAFRWIFPRQEHWNSYSLLDEETGFHTAEDPVVLASFLRNYTTSHEGRYTRLPLSSVKSDTLMDTPVLLTFSDARKFADSRTSDGHNPIYM